MYFFNKFPYLLGPTTNLSLFVLYFYLLQFPYNSIVLTTEGGCVTKSHGLGSNGGDTQSLSAVITIFGESNLPTTLVLKNKCPAHC